MELPNINFRSDCAVRGLIDGKGCVGGVVYDNDDASHTIMSDLVVDASGRGSHASRWLRQCGFSAPKETTIGIDFAYTSAKYRIPNWPEPERLLSLRASGPDDPKISLIEEIEGNVFHLSLGGRFGDYPPDDEQGFLAFAKSLRTSKLYDLIKDAEGGLPTSQRIGFPRAFCAITKSLQCFPNGAANPFSQ